MKLSVLLLGGSQLILHASAAAVEAVRPAPADDNSEPVVAESFFADTPIVKLIWEKNLVSGESMTTLWDSSLSNLHAYSCGNNAKTGDVSIAVAVDEEASGSLTIGSKTYNIDFDPTDSGGISCSRMYNDESAVTECLVPATVFSELPLLPVNSTAECFSNVAVDDGLASVPLTDPTFGDEEGDESDDDEHDPSGITDPEDIFATPEKRNICANSTRCRYMRDTNPQNPEDYCCRSFRIEGGAHRKWRRHIFMARGTCGGGPCYVETKNTAVHHARITGSPKGALTHTNGEWTHGNLKVKRSHSSIRGSIVGPYRCTGKARDTICVKNYHRYQQYPIYTAYWRAAYHQDTTAYQVRSPLSASGQNVWYCIVNKCSASGTVTWEDRGSGKHGGV